MKKTLLLFLVVIVPFIFGSANELEHIQTSVSSEITFGQGEHAPFWLTANRHGVNSLAPNQAYLRASLLRHDIKESRWGWEYGMDIVGGWHHEQPIAVQQLYAGLRYGCWELTIGQKEYDSQGKNQRLSTGGLTWSGNARPIPQVRFGIYDYTPISFLFNDWVAVKGFLSYGRFTDDIFQKQFASRAEGNQYFMGALLHEKSAFLKIGDEQRFPMTMEAGLEIDSQFGGDIYIHQADHEELFYAMPSAPMDYIRALLMMSGGSDSRAIDQRNKAGNTLGSWHIALNYHGDGWKLRGYYEHFFEDRSAMFGVTHPVSLSGEQLLYIYPWKDGLWGIEATLPSNPVAGNVVFEFINTRYQSGPVQHERSSLIPLQISGGDYYFNHSSYVSWNHYGRSIGTPIALSPLYNVNGNLAIPYDRFRTFHFGFGNTIGAWQWRGLFTQSTNWGSYYAPLSRPAKQWFGLIETSWTPTHLKGWTLMVAFAFDKSELTHGDTGYQMRIQKTF